MTGASLQPDGSSGLRPFRRRGLIALGGLLLLLLGGLLLVETVARYGLGLGTPPLTVQDSEIEYLFAGPQDVQRFGNRQLYNRFGMRSGEPPPPKDSVLRVLLLGDSVINGGSRTDHEDLASSRLQAALRQCGHPRAWVGNASATSWGPQNLLAYTRRFGFFSADAVVIEVSAHDLADTPTFGPLNPRTHPQARPLSATTEGLFRYLPRYLPDHLLPALSEPGPARSWRDDAGAAEELRDGAAAVALRTLLAAAAATGARVILVYHAARDEMERKADEPYKNVLLEVVASTGTPVFELSDRLDPADYRDSIHLNDGGQAELGALIFEWTQLVFPMPDANLRDPSRGS